MSVQGQLAVYTQHRFTGRTTMAPEGESSLRAWSCTLQEGRPRVANVALLPYVKDVEFILHPSFDNPHRVRSKPPFRIKEEGWGQFDLKIVVHFFHCSDTVTIDHYLTFPEEGSDYQVYPFKIPNPTPGFLSLYNKNTTTVSRKTIPARATKARKGLPRDSAHSGHRRSPYDSDSGSSGGSSDSDNTDTGGSNGHAVRSGRVSSRPRSAKEPRTSKEPPRPSTSIKHGPAQPADWEQRRKGGNSRTTPGSEHMSSPQSPADHYQKASRPSSRGTQARRTRDESLPRSRPPAGVETGAQARRINGQSATPQRPRAPADIGSSPNRPERMLAGAKRRLSDAPDSGERPAVRRRTVDPARTPSSSPPSAGSRASHKRGDSGIRPIKRSLAGAIAEVRVPKKRPIKAAEEEDEPPKNTSIADVRVPKKRAIKILSDEDKSPKNGTLPQQSPRKPPTATRRVIRDEDLRESSQTASGREAFIRERERQRQALQQAAQTPAKSAAGPSGIRPVKQSGSSGVIARSQRPAANGTAGSKAKRPGELLDVSRNDTTNDVANEPRRVANRRESAVPAKQKPMPPPAVPPASGHNSSRSRERVSPLYDQTKTALINSVPRMKRTATNGSQEKPSAKPAVNEKDALPVNTAEKMQRIMRKAQVMDDMNTVRFLHLLYTLRVEQEPTREDAITSELLSAVEKDKYSYNLSVLQPKAIDRLWSFVKKIPSS